MPKGFLERTKDSGMVVKSWAAGGGVGGFVTQ